MGEYLKALFILSVLSVAACTCDPVYPEDTSPDDATMDTQPDAPTDSAPMDSSPTDSASDAADSAADAAVDSAPADSGMDTLVGPCGDFGQRCCPSDPPCISTFMCCTGAGFPENGECRDFCE